MLPDRKTGQPSRAARRLGRALALTACLGLLLCQCAPQADLRANRGLQPSVPETAQPGATGTLYVNLPPYYSASMYLSPIDGELVSEWPGGTRLAALGMSFDDEHGSWRLVRDPSGNDGWIAGLFLDEQPPSTDPSEPESYLAPVYWGGRIALCVNPSGGPPGLDGDAFVALVERAADRWQEVADGVLPLDLLGRCDRDPAAHGDGMNAVGWVRDLGLVIAALSWPNAETGLMSEVDIQLSRGYFERLQARDPSRSLQTCVFSTVVHELGHLLGLDHPRSRLLASSMQGVGASKCDKGQPTALDRENLLRRYAPRRIGSP
jgi:hypothetical protein